LRAFSEIYNPSLAPRVVALLARDYPEIQLTMIGPDKADGSLQRMRQTAVQLGVSDSIRTPGAVLKAEVPGWLNQGDVFLNTTNIDNTPVSMLEAMACGMCVISTNVGGIPYLVADGRHALLVPPNDPEAMAHAVRRVLTDPDLAERISKHARLESEQYSWSMVLPAWERLLFAVAKGERPGDPGGCGDWRGAEGADAWSRREQNGMSAREELNLQGPSGRGQAEHAPSAASTRSM
jgi:glycosyltransferase involved in cell wall biosynthesis